MSPQRTVYLIATSAPPVLSLPTLVKLLHDRGWSVCPILSPTAATWIEPRKLEEATGGPVHTHSQLPGEENPMPRADAVLAAPLTFNTVNKWAGGISDTLAAGLLNELLGAGVPMVAAPCVKSLLQSHPAYVASVQRLTECGATFLDPAQTVFKTDAGLANFEWSRLVEALDDEKQ